jgi:hypothetical protein
MRRLFCPETIRPLPSLTPTSLPYFGQESRRYGSNEREPRMIGGSNSQKWPQGVQFDTLGVPPHGATMRVSLLCMSIGVKSLFSNFNSVKFSRELTLRPTVRLPLQRASMLYSQYPPEYSVDCISPLSSLGCSTVRSRRLLREQSVQFSWYTRGPRYNIKLQGQFDVTVVYRNSQRSKLELNPRL